LNEVLDQLISRITDNVSERVMLRMSDKLKSEPLAYSMEEAAEKLTLSETTLRRMIRRRELPVVKRGTRVLITRKISSISLMQTGREGLSA
jgi:excisionase family DNA binding protein